MLKAFIESGRVSIIPVGFNAKVEGGEMQEKREGRESE